MPRPTIGTMSQEQLVAELRRYIDTARFAPVGSVTEVDAINKVIEIAQTNSVSVLRPHVLHNIGCRRRKWLRQLSTTMPRGFASDLLWQMGCDGRAVARVGEYAVG